MVFPGSGFPNPPIGRLVARPDAASLFEACGEWIVERLSHLGGRRGPIFIALSGGSTPRGLYTLLGQKPLASRIPWDRLYLFWVDERCVGSESPQSNFRLVRETILDHVPLAPERVLRMQGEADPEEETVRYGDLLKELLPGVGNEWPHLDLVLLGLGSDGHTASLFPDPDPENAPRLEQTDQVCAVVRHPESGQQRLTLTLPVINRAREVLFLATGASKRPVLQEIFAQGRGACRFPASRVQPFSGRLTWFLDHAALPNGPVQGLVAREARGGSV